MTPPYIFQDEGDLDNESIWEDEGGPPRSEEDPRKVTLQEAEIYLEIREGIPWDDSCRMVSD